LAVKQGWRNADRTSVSLRPRILAAVVIPAVLVLAGAFLLLGRGQGTSSAAVNEIKPLHPVKKHLTSASKPAARKIKKVAARVAVKPKAKAKPKGPAVIDGMPAALARALESHEVVVVSLYAPKSAVDAMATDEAEHGARLSGAGFVALNVANEKVVSPLTSLLTGAQTAADRILGGPAVLVFQRPKTLFVRFNGFADRDTVAQAAANAAIAR
jgi:hypothetical protein